MDLNSQQRLCIKFCIKNTFNGAENLEMWGKYCYVTDTLKNRHPFTSGMNAAEEIREFTEDDENHSRSSTSKADENINEVKEKMTNSHKLTNREQTESLALLMDTFRELLIRFTQKSDRLEIAKGVIYKSESDPTFI